MKIKILFSPSFPSSLKKDQVPKMWTKHCALGQVSWALLNQPLLLGQGLPTGQGIPFSRQILLHFL
ncbi:MAG: hypothetical protein PWK00_05425, partial [Coxiella burnetii]|nr:hypothetical protein [Coxiella burnetii]